MGHPGRGRLSTGGPWVPREGIYPDGTGIMAIDPLCRMYFPGAGGIATYLFPFSSGGMGPR